MSRAKTEYRYEKLTWPEINDAVDLGKVCIVPCGAVEQHGHHLPLDVDLVCPGGIAKGTGMALADKVLVLPIPGLRLHRARDGLPRDDQHELHDVHGAGPGRHAVAGVPRVQEDHPPERPRLEHAEPRPGRPPHQPRDRRPVRRHRLVEPAHRRQDLPAGLARKQVPRRLRPRLRAGNLALPVPRRRHVRKDKIKAT